MTVETDIAAIADAGNNTPGDVRTALTSVLGASPDRIQYLARRLSGETATASDDFFDDASLTGWTTITTSGGQTLTESNDVLNVKITSAQTSLDMNGIVKSVSPATGSYIETAVDRIVPTGNVHNGALIMADGETATDNVAMAGFYFLSGSWYAYHSAGTWTDYQTTGSGQTVIAVAPKPMFVRLNYSATNTFYGEWSSDGVGWTTFGMSALSKTMTPSRIGLCWTGNGSTGGLYTFHYFRYKA